MRISLVITLVFGLHVFSIAQEKFTVACIAFYNLENLFDTIDSPDTDDFEFLPNGTNLYNTEVYYDKLGKLSRVLGEIGTQHTPDGAALIGVSEIENITVLEDLVKQPAIASRGYKIIHKDSRDGRGVDVALLYQPKYFTPLNTCFYPLKTNTEDEEVRYSRDILIATGLLNGEPIAVSVNHWPSRRGGEQTTAWLRNKAAAWNKKLLDSIATNLNIEKAFIMGDLNDDPVSESIKKILVTGRDIEKLDEDEMYNPFEAFYRKGLGTTAYQDAWSLFDQIIVSHEAATAKDGYRFYKAFVFNPEYLTQKSGTFKGYPLRTYANGIYAGGYSDHFPVYILVVKPES